MYVGRREEGRRAGSSVVCGSGVSVAELSPGHACSGLMRSTGSRGWVYVAAVIAMIEGGRRSKGEVTRCKKTTIHLMRLN